jgi:endoglucanase
MLLAACDVPSSGAAGKPDGSAGSGTGTGSGTGSGSGSGSGPLAGDVPIRGTSLAGAEFGQQNLPGTFGADYTYPTDAEVTYFVGKGMTTFRLPFLWERLQHQAKGELDATELGRIDAFVTAATGKGALVLLDPHNYARYFGKVVGTETPAADLADLWSRLAAHYKGNPRVLFGIMNEPHDMSTEVWAQDANAAIAAIRAAGATNLITVPGNAWTGAHSWFSSSYGTPNATAMLTITDPGNNFAFEVHQYLDSDSSGTMPACVSATIGSERMSALTAWLRAHHVRAILGEVGAPSDATCMAALGDILRHVHANKDVYLGWTYWAAGPWWGNYFLSIEPTGGGDAPQMAVLAPLLAAPH